MDTRYLVSVNLSAYILLNYGTHQRAVCACVKILRVLIGKTGKSPKSAQKYIIFLAHDNNIINLTGK